MIFRGWQKTSLNEWPGKVCSVVFIAGCNFRCPFCYNRNLVLNPERLPVVKEKNVLDYCRKNKDLLDGIMITGGEPLKDQKLNISAEGSLSAHWRRPASRSGSEDPSGSRTTGEKDKTSELIEFIKKIKTIGLKVGIETNGSNPEAIKYLVKNKLVDYVAMDIKAPLVKKKYYQLTGRNVDLNKIKKSIGIIIDSNINSEFRTTVVPGLLDKKDILKIVKSIKGAKKYYLQKFQSGETIEKIPEKVNYEQEWFGGILKDLKKTINIELRI